MTGGLEYQVFGLRVRSEIALPELLPASGEGLPDVSIRWGMLPHSDAAGLSAEGDALLLTIPDVGRYRVSGGSEILVSPRPDAPDRNIRLFLLGSAFGALLHQRGLLPLHANAVEIEGKAVAFMGESGAGKSTLAAWFHDRGYRVIADDVCVIRFDDGGRALAQPGLPRLRLWRDALRGSGRDVTDFTSSFVGDDSLDKYDVPILPEAALDRELAIAAVYLLERGDDLEVERLIGLEAADALFAHTYRGAFVAPSGNEQRHWRTCIQLVRTTPLFRVRRAWEFDRIDDQCRKLLVHVRSTLAACSFQTG